MPIIGPISPGGLANAVKRAALSVTTRVRPDHQAIARRNVRFNRHDMGKIYLYQAVAPSRWRKRARDDGQVGRAVAFIDTAFPGVFSGDGESGKPEPEGASADWTRFQVNNEFGYPSQYIYVHPTGLVEVQWALSVSTNAEDTMVLDATEIALLVMSLVCAVRSDAYANLSNMGRRWWRRRISRVDWFFDLALRAVGPSGQMGWKKLSFPVPAPPRTNQDWVDPPAEGYGRPTTWFVRRRVDPSVIAQAVLADLASASGYYDCAEAVTATVQVAAQRLAG